MQFGVGPFQFTVAVRVRLNLETLTLILKPQSAILLGVEKKIKVRVWGLILEPFIVRVTLKVISGCDVPFNMSTAVAIKLQTEKCFFYPPVKHR